MIDKNNKYTILQKNHYREGTSDHLEHNDNDDYWDILLAPICNVDNKSKKDLDFGCGKGRNIQMI